VLICAFLNRREPETLVSEGLSTAVLVRKIAADNGYQQRVICTGSKTASDGSLEPLQMIFCVVVVARYDTVMDSSWPGSLPATVSVFFHWGWSYRSLSHYWYQWKNPDKLSLQLHQECK
jgi:hypothetical protein